MRYRAGTPERARDEGTTDVEGLPRPSLQFRLRCWRAFQRALDPLGPPRPLPQPRRRG